MFTWLSKDDYKKNHIDVYESVLEGLKKTYKSKVLPLESNYLFHDFHSPALDEPDFDAKPMLLLVGQYSTGKTTFIRYLLERDFPGIRIGPEPTTDGFISVMYDENDGVIPGNALVVDPKKPFRPLSKFGNAFLNRFQCSHLNSKVLKGISIIDTPGILSGEKQRVDRGYNFTGVLEWLFEAEEQDLFADLQSLPRNAALRKLNDLIKRARLAKVHAYIISELKKEMPSVFGKDSKKKELIKNLGTIYEKIQREHQISPGDFPDLKRMQDQLQHHDFTKFNPLKQRLLDNVDRMLAEEIAKLMAMIPQEEALSANKDTATVKAAKAEMVKSKLPNSVLGKVWKLSDIDKDGMLDADEFALAMHLINVKLDGHDIPSDPADLPEHLVPPSKRSFHA
ncbi:Epidermal growth factor receptor substrate 15-like 1 [Armadillidium vulgare]|nr:Epidermal growth factor receptor substrate 15-like 1 [Armadillidium vulgare]